MKNNSPLKWIFARTKNVRLKMVLLILGNAIFSVLSVLFAFGVKEVIDGAIKAQNGESTKLLIRGAIFICSLVVLQLLFRVFNHGLEESIKARIEINCKRYIFSKILVKKYDKIGSYHSAELMNRLTSDTSIISDGVTTLLPTIISAVVRLVSAVSALILLDIIFALALIIAGLLVFLITTLLRGVLKNLHKKSLETDGKTRSFMQEIIENLLAVKSFAVNDKVEEKSDALQEQNYKVKMKRRNYAVLGNSFFHFIFSAGYVFALIYGGFQIAGSLLTYGELSAILQLVNNVQVPFASLSSVFPKYYGVIASAERLIEIEQIEEEDFDEVADGRAIYKLMDSINIQNVNFAYDKKPVLKNASLKINKGDFIAITGTSGVGKSTLLKLILGVYNVSQGEIFVESKNKKITIDGSKRNMFAYVPQGNALFSGTLYENISFINDNATKEQIDRALDVSCSIDFIKDLPLGLQTEIGEQGEGLSEGQVQRIAIARAILSDAPVLLLDEATSALDEDTEKRVLEKLKGLKDKTLVIITHKKAALSVCNRKIKIKKGEIIESE